jgi:hypothetical protein
MCKMTTLRLFNARYMRSPSGCLGYRLVICDFERDYTASTAFTNIPSNYYVMAPMELAAEEIVFSDVIEKDQFGSASIFRFVPCGILVPDACTITSWGLECEVPRSCHDPVGPGPYLDIHCNFEGYRGCGPSGTGPLKCGAIVNCPEIPPM